MRRSDDPLPGDDGCYPVQAPRFRGFFVSNGFYARGGGKRG